MPSPAALLIGVAGLLLLLHLQPHGVNLLGFHPKALEQGLAGLLVAAEATEACTVGVLLAAIDAESHGAPSMVGRACLI
jgi:hypothetical protein